MDISDIVSYYSELEEKLLIGWSKSTLWDYIKERCLYANRKFNRGYGIKELQRVM